MTKKISEIIKERIELAGEGYFSNNNISEFIEPGELELLKEEVEENIRTLMNSLVIDTVNDHNSNDTPRRIAKMYIDEIYSGRYLQEPHITTFPNHQTYDELYVVGPITVKSCCAHHWMPITGSAYIGISPGTKVIGLSKLHRFTDFFSRRPQIQEELTVQLANKIKEITGANGVGVQIDAEHGCVFCRGVNDKSSMITSVLLGSFRELETQKNEFMKLVSDIKHTK